MRRKGATDKGQENQQNNLSSAIERASIKLWQCYRYFPQWRRRKAQPKTMNGHLCSRSCATQHISRLTRQKTPWLVRSNLMSRSNEGTPESVTYQEHWKTTATYNNASRLQQIRQTSGNWRQRSRRQIRDEGHLQWIEGNVENRDIRRWNEYLWLKESCDKMKRTLPEATQWKRQSTWGEVIHLELWKHGGHNMCNRLHQLIINAWDESSAIVEGVGIV